MTYTAATASTFKTRFPAFAAVDDDVIEAALVRSRQVVTDNWLSQTQRTEGEMLYAAHDMALDGLGTDQKTRLRNFRSLKLGSLSLSTDFGGESDDMYSGTTYGPRFKALLVRNMHNILVV